MNLVQALRLGGSSRIALVGAGGKTTAMFHIARELPPPVWVTTSTHLGVDQLPLADRHVLYPALEDEIDAACQAGTGVTVFTSASDQARAAGLSPQELLEIKLAADKNNIPLLIEADGSRTLPLKAPAGHEPVIPGWVDLVIVCAGLSGIGQHLDESCVHRSEIFSEMSGIPLGQEITLEGLEKVLLHPEGGLKGIPPGVRRAVLLNQADSLPDLAPLHSTASRLLRRYDAALVSALSPRQDDRSNVLAVHEPYAAVVLAAGESKRLQRPKQLLNWRGEPLVRRVAKTALAAGCRPVVVVTGAYALEVEQCLVDLPVQLVHNAEWATGQSSSIRRGIASLPRETGSTFFLLSDQPQVPPELVRTLAIAHSRSMAPVIAPRTGGRRANPVLFDRVTFDRLLNLSGDTGGRSIFDQVAVELVDWDDPSLLLDVDTPEDYLALLDYE